MVYVYLIALLLLLWAIDAYLTMKVFKKYGPTAEENPILKQLLRHNVKHFLVFKLVDAAAFVAIILLIINKNETIATLLLTGFIVLYTYVNLKSSQVLLGKFE